MNRKTFALAVAAIVAAGLLAAGCGGQDKGAAAPPQAEKPPEIRIAYQNSSPVILLAKAKGLYEEEFAKDGITVKYDLYLAGPPMNEAFAGGRADFGQMGDMPPILARSAGVDIKIISRAGYTPAGNALVIRPDSQYTAVKELKGKKIATQVGSSAHHFLILVLKENGLTVNDVSIVNLPAPDHRAALETGNVEAIATWEPWYSTLEAAQAVKPLVDSSQGAKRYLSVMVARNDFARRYPDIVERFLKVNEKAADFIRKNPAEAAEIIAKESKLPVVAFARVVKSTDWDSTITPADLDAFQKVKVFLQDTKVLKKDFDLGELFDDRYLKKIKN